MEESDIDSYKLNSDDRKQSLRISLINNERISMILINLTTKQRYTVLVSLEKLRQLCEIFLTSKTIKEALQIIKNTIESGKIMITEDPQNNNEIELRYTPISEIKEYPPFDINLTLEKENNEEEEVEILPPKFDYLSNREDESKYANLTKSTTQFNKPIIQSDIKPPILELEYIEPILQVHYPDGTTESKALPPRIQGVNGETPNISEEQFKSIREQISQNNTIKNFSPLKELLNNKTSPLIKRSASLYSIQSNPYSKTNNISRVNPFNPQKEPKDNNKLNRTSSGYSIMTMQSKNLYGYGNDNSQILNSPINLNNTNIFINSKYIKSGPNSNHNKIVERRPRMINKYNERNFNSIDANRSLSTPHENIYKFKSNQNPNQSHISQLNNPFESKQNQKRNKIMDENEKYPYDRNTQRQPLSNNNIPIYKSNFQITGLSNIEQTEKFQIIKKKLDEIKQQQKQLNNLQKQITLQHQQQNADLIKKIQPRIQFRQQLKIIPKQSTRQNQQISQNESINNFNPQFQSHNQLNPSSINQERLEQNNLLMYNQQILGHTNSGKINHNKIQIINNNENSYKKQASTPISSKIISLINKDSSQELLSLAHISSKKNETNLDNENLQETILEEQNQQNEEKKEIQDFQPNIEISENTYKNPEKINNENSNLFGAKGLEGEQKIDIEALFFTEEGRVIFRNGLLRGIIHKYAEIDDVVSKIQDKLLKGVKFHLVYKAFDVGDKAETFHEKCDNLNMSLILIETDKDIRFGGFTTKSWGGNCIKKIDNDSFVFSLDNKKIYDIIPNEPAIGCYPKFGPIFLGCQIRIYDTFFTKGGTTCHKGLNYKTNLDYELNNGESNFKIKDIEIYGIETIDY